MSLGPASAIVSRRRTSLPSFVLSLASLALALAPSASAQDATSGAFPLSVELHRGMEADFGDVVVEEDGVGGLHFHVALDPGVVGERARVRRVFLSMAGMPEGLAVVPDDPDAMRGLVYPAHHEWRTMGAELGVVVALRERAESDAHRRCHRDRHSHRGHHGGKGPMLEAGFTLVASAPLALADVLAVTSTWRGDATQVGVGVDDAELGRRLRPALLGGLFEADPPAPGGGSGGGVGSGGGGSGGGGVIPPGCFGEIDPLTGEVINLICP
ncbi:MAG: hypothetical protein R3E88_16135 [Myxococcota bacterium]